MGFWAGRNQPPTGGSANSVRRQQSAAGRQERAGLTLGVAGLLGLGAVLGGVFVVAPADRHVSR